MRVRPHRSRTPESNQVGSLGAAAPVIVEADVADSDGTKMLFETIKQKFGRLHAFISNASDTVTVQSLDDFTERAFLKSLRASAWPTVEYTLAAKKYLGHYPRYAVVMSSDGPDRFTPAWISTT
jgi:NAD(P)-dependent dehydrogenase (short-subunit alcohol dehydrogenase family)